MWCENFAKCYDPTANHVALTWAVKKVYVDHQHSFHVHVAGVHISYLLDSACIHSGLQFYAFMIYELKKKLTKN
jgi:hypothetical protein